MNDAAIQSFLEHTDSRFDSARSLLTTRVPEGHYNPWTAHCGLDPGSEAHHLRESMIYAIALLDSGREGVEERARSIVRTVLSFQDRDSTSERYGIWPMYAEEPLEVLRIPDWNYADFVGSQMVYVLGRHGARLAGRNETEFGDALRRAVTCAAWSIFRRNVQPVYTNIAIAGAAVTARVAELVGDGVLLDYARSRLSSILAHRAHHGGFAEYNAPGYTLAGMKWCEWISQLVEDREVCDQAEQLHRVMWADYVEHFHPETGQLAGPHSRAYSPWIRPSLVRFIEGATGLTLPQSSRATELPSITEEYDFFGYVARLRCPEDIVQRFRDAGNSKSEHRHTYVRGTDEGSSTIGTTWISGNATLGSVNSDCTFVQRNPLIAYWRGTREAAAMCRVRLLRDLRDFASGWIWTKQKENRALSAFGLVTDRGDWHRHLDPPDPPGVFETRDFRIRYELVGTGARLNRLSERVWELCCPPYRIALHTAVSRVGQFNVEWQGGGEAEDDEVHLDGVWYCGASRVFDFHALEDLRIACGLELLPDGVEPVGEPISTLEGTTGEIVYGWGGLEVRAPTRPFAAG